MHVFLVLGVAGFLFCLLLTPLCRDLFLHAGLVDKPDLDRKFHLRAVPRVGGVPIALSYAGALVLVFSFNPGGARLYVQHHVLFHAMLPAAAIVFLVGLLDDVVGLRPWQKLLGQVVAAGLAVGLGARLALFPTHPSVSVVLSVVWLIACSNAVNLIDGMDGLATGVSLLAVLSMLLVALLNGNTGLALATVPLAGALLAFLRYNFSPASVFLGDCGSLTIGFVLGCFALAWSRQGGTLLSLLAPLMALSLPLIDVLLAIGRRFLRAVPIFKGDRGHIHHRVQALGFSTRHTALLLYAVGSLAATLAILESLSHGRLVLPELVVFFALVLLGVRRLKYVEFSAARKTFSHVVFRGVVQDHIYMEELERSLLTTHTPDEWWLVVRDIGQDLSFASAYLELDGYTFSERFTEAEDTATSCRINLGLGGRGFLELVRLEGSLPPRHMMAVLHRLQGALEETELHFAKVASVKTAHSNAA